MADIMGSGGLAFYQWKKHGRCSGLSADRYFATARRLFDALDLPAPDDGRATAAEVEAAFLAANPVLAPEAVIVTCGDGRVSEVRICLTREFAPRDVQRRRAARRLPGPRPARPPAGGLASVLGPIGGAVVHLVLRVDSVGSRRRGDAARQPLEDAERDEGEHRRRKQHRGIDRLRQSVRPASKTMTNASRETAMTMMVMNLVSERRASTAERSSRRRTSSSSAMKRAVSMIAKPMMTRPALSRTPTTSPWRSAVTISHAAQPRRTMASRMRKATASTK